MEKKIYKIQKQGLRYVIHDFNASYNEWLEKSNRPLMYTQRLRRILSFVEKVLKGNIIPNCKCIRFQGLSLWNRVHNKFKLTAIFNE